MARRIKTMKQTTTKTVTATVKMPRREDIRGIAPELNDLSDWKQAAAFLKIRPFYTGADSLPWSCFMATQFLLDPPPKKGGKSVNDFLLAPECRL